MYRVLSARKADAQLEAAAILLIQRCCRRFVAVRTRVGTSDRTTVLAIRQRFEDGLIQWREALSDGGECVHARVAMIRRDEKIGRQLRASLKELASLQQSVDDRVR